MIRGQGLLRTTAVGEASSSASGDLYDANGYYGGTYPVQEIPGDPSRKTAGQRMPLGQAGPL